MHSIAHQPEELSLFVSNVLREVGQDAYRLCCDMVCSRVLEKLLEVAPPPLLLRFVAYVVPHMRDLSMHRYGSHVITAIVVKVLPNIGFKASEIDSGLCDFLHIVDTAHCFALNI